MTNFSKILYDLRASLNAQQTVIAYNGPITQDVIEGLGTSLEQHLQLNGANTAIIQRVFAVFIEGMQNILHYSNDKVPDNTKHNALSTGVMTVGYQDEQFHLSFGNGMLNSHIEPMMTQLHRISVMTHEELKNHYKQQRKKDRSELSRGAGLGLFDMSLKASQPLDYNFLAIDNVSSFFSLKVII
jgi:hypothetical protein